MKKLFIILLPLMLATAACADSWEQPNSGGGKIILTDRACPDKAFSTLMSAYTFIKSGKTVYGCWVVLDGKVQIAWDNGERSTFEPTAFTKGNGVTAISPAAATPKTY